MREQLRRRLGAPEAGMTIVEVLAAMVILGILSVVVLGVIIQTQHKEVDNRSRIAAANLASREIDIVRDEFGRSKTAPLDIANQGTVVNPHQFGGAVQGDPLMLDGKAYTVTRTVEWNVIGDGGSACDGGTAVVYPTLGVTVTVTWPNMNGTKPVTSSTQLAPDKGSGMPATTSYVVAKVVDSLGHPSSGRTVTVTGPSESHNGTTDVTGCAVVPVTPPLAGATYVATLGDPGYVDITGNNTPAKTTGNLTQGQLSNVLSFAYDQAASLQLDIVDSSGATVDPATLNGSDVTVVAFEASGAGDSSVHQVTGGAITGLWPTTYGAYFGQVAPGTYDTVKLGPGQTGTVTIHLQMAIASISGMPDGTASVVALTGANAGTCAAPGGAPTIDPGGFQLVPNTWTFWAYGPKFDCAKGPTIELAGGDNGPQTWAPTMLGASGIPADGSLWMVSATRWTAPTASPNSCPDATTQAQYGISVDALRTGTLPIPAGSWYVYRVDSTGVCHVPLNNHYPQQVDYAATYTLPWSETLSTFTVKLTNVAHSTWSNYRVFATQSSTTPTCNQSGVPTNAGSLVQFSPTNNTAPSASFTTAGKWYFYVQKTNTSSYAACLQATGNPITIPGVASSYTVNWNTGAVSTP